MYYRSATIVFSVCTALLCLLVIRADEISADRIIDTVRCLRTCLLQFRCNPYYHPDNELVYALENGVCKVFTNGCAFASNNCNLQNSCLPVLVPIPKEKCIGSCPVCDNVEKKPVCAVYRYISDSEVDQVTYQNQCLADREACLSGKPHAFTTEGSCSYKVGELENL